MRKVLLGTSYLTNFHRIYEILWPRPPFFRNEGKTYNRTFMSPNVDKVAIIYGIKSGHVRQHVFSETDHMEYEVQRLQLGEAICFVPIAFHHAGHKAFEWAIRKAVLEHGKVSAVLFPGEPGSRMFAHIDRAGIIDNIVMADPDIPGDRDVIERDRWVEFEFGTLAIGDFIEIECREAA